MRLHYAWLIYILDYIIKIIININRPYSFVQKDEHTFFAMNYTLNIRTKQ